MNRIVVTGIGLVTALGNCAETWSQLLVGKSGIVSTSTYPIASISNIKLNAKFPVQPRVESLLWQAIESALNNLQYPMDWEDCGIVVGSSRSYQADWEKGHLLLPSQLSIQVACQIKTQAPVIAISAACATGNWVIARGLQLLNTNQCRVAIVAAVDSAITPLSIAGFQQMGALAKNGCYPFSKEREGLVLGEGACALVLEKLPTNNSAYGEILGIGITNDAYHITTPDPTGAAAQQAIQNCLSEAKLPPAAIDVISPHGTATKYNDQIEATAIEALFPNYPWICSSKGATGHALGATGLMEAAFCLLMLRDQIIFPCVGLRTPAFDLHFADRALPTPIHYALNISFGFGGQNAVVCFGSSSFS